MNFDNDADTSDTEYFAFVEWLSERTVAELRVSRGDTKKQRQVLCHYLKRGENANLTASELIDFLGVSTPSLLDRADYSDAEGDAIMNLLANLTDEEIEQAAV